MKNLLLPVLASGMFAIAHPPTDSETRCTIVTINNPTTDILVRDKTTDRLYQFGADALDMKAGVSDTGKRNSGDKWVITPNNLKGASGRILIDNPAGSKWVVYIYAMADNKYITSFAESNNKGLVTILPGEYKVTINNAPVLHVPVKKGHDTKLICGTLDVVSPGVWYLYDETGKDYYTSGNTPSKMPLPVGNYTFDLGGSKQAIVIKNGETVEM